MSLSRLTITLSLSLPGWSPLEGERYRDQSDAGWLLVTSSLVPSLPLPGSCRPLPLHPCSVQPRTAALQHCRQCPTTARLATSPARPANIIFIAELRTAAINLIEVCLERERERESKVFYSISNRLTLSRRTRSLFQSFNNANVRITQLKMQQNCKQILISRLGELNQINQLDMYI